MAEYILRPPKADGEDGYILKAPEKPLAVRAGEELMQIPRQLGLATRYGIEGLADTAGIVSEPIRAFLNPALRAVGLPTAGSPREAASVITDRLLSLPQPEGANERVIGDASRLVAGTMGLGGAANQAAKVLTNPVAQSVAGSMANNMGVQGVSAATAGVAGGATREAGGGPLAQFSAALIGGLGGAGAAVAAQKAGSAVMDAVRGMITPKSSLYDVNVVLNDYLAQNGMDVSKIPQIVRAELASEVKKALDTGRELNPDVIRRIADYGAVGATPTRGTVTLDPAIVTREKNLAKLGANSSDENLQQLAQVQNANNATLIRNLNEMGANTANADPRVAGPRIIEAITSRDAAAKAVEKGLYDRARDSAGRAIQLDSEGFVYDAYRRLADSNKGAFLPPEIAKTLEQLRIGKQVLPDGREVPFPFTVDTIDNIKTMLATAQRAAKDGNTSQALSQVRSALDDVRPSAVGNPPTGNTLPVDPNKLAQAQAQADTLSKESLDAFDAARRFARARRNWQESAAGIKAALDDPNSDRFIQDFVLANGNKSSTAELEAMMHTVRRDPGAMQAGRENILAYLKRQALGAGTADEVGNFSASNYRAALDAIGDMKLRLFFTQDQIAHLKAVGRVANYETVQPRGSAVNNSNSAATLGGWFVDILNKIGNNNLIGRLPMGDSMVRTPAKNWAAQIEVKSAMDPTGAIANAPAKTNQPMRLSDLIAPGLLLSAPRADGGEDKKRR